MYSKLYFEVKLQNYGIKLQFIQQRSPVLIMYIRKKNGYNYNIINVINAYKCFSPKILQEHTNKLRLFNVTTGLIANATTI